MRHGIAMSLGSVLALLAFPGIVTAITILVPADQPTIQAGIDAAVDGDVVLVSPGTYFENINFQGKAIQVTSSYGPGVTTILSPLSGDAVTFATGENLDHPFEFGFAADQRIEHPALGQLGEIARELVEERGLFLLFWQRTPLVDIDRIFADREQAHAALDQHAAGSRFLEA